MYSILNLKGLLENHFKKVKYKLTFLIFIIFSEQGKQISSSNEIKARMKLTAFEFQINRPATIFKMEILFRNL